jgi:hypothetical protein
VSVVEEAASGALDEALAAASVVVATVVVAGAVMPPKLSDIIAVSPDPEVSGGGDVISGAEAGWFATAAVELVFAVEVEMMPVVAPSPQFPGTAFKIPFSTMMQYGFLVSTSKMVTPEGCVDVPTVRFCVAMF